MFNRKFSIDGIGTHPYYCALMPNTPSLKPLPRQIDPRKLAQKGVSLNGNIALSELRRFSAAVLNMVEDVVADLTFSVDQQKLRRVTGRVWAQPNMTCQRCLQSVSVSLEGELNLAVVWDEEGAKQLPKSIDPWIVEESPADLYEIIEEELLLALPIAAYHDDQCIEASLFSAGEAVEKVKPANNPFQVLEQLKGSPK